MKQVHELTTDELRRLLKLREEQDAILEQGLSTDEYVQGFDESMDALKGKRAGKKPHWTQTPAGKRKMKVSQTKAWAERKARHHASSLAGGGGSNTP